MRADLLAIALLCQSLGAPADGTDPGRVPVSAPCQAPQLAVAGPDRDDVHHHMRYAVVEQPERFRIRLVPEHETKTFPMNVLPHPRR